MTSSRGSERVASGGFARAGRDDFALLLRTVAMREC
jgi:hypothetical protein